MDAITTVWCRYCQAHKPGEPDNVIATCDECKAAGRIHGADCNLRKSWGAPFDFSCTCGLLKR